MSSQGIKQYVDNPDSENSWQNQNRTDATLNTKYRTATQGSLRGPVRYFNGNPDMGIEDWHKMGDYDLPGVRIDPIKAISDSYRAEITAKRKDWPNLSRPASTYSLRLYEEVKRSGTYNVFAVRKEVKSGLNYQNLEAMKTGHMDDDWLVDLVRFGFPLQYRGEGFRGRPGEHSNHSSATSFQSAVDQFIDKEIKNDTIIGPFAERPFEWLYAAPLMTRPKTNPENRRIIVDYTYPPGQGVNASINKGEVFGVHLEHTLPTVGRVVWCIQDQNSEVMLATVDLERAYRNFRTDLLDWPLTCIQNHGRYYIDTGVPFGSRTSSLYIQRVAEFIHRSLIAKGIYMLTYLDDGLIIINKDQNPHEVMREVMATIRALGLPLAYEKLQIPAKVCTFLGIEIDLEQKILRIPVQKLKKFIVLIDEIHNKSCISRRQLQSIIGSANHLAKCVQGARLFMNRLLHCLRSATGDSITVDNEMKADFMWYKQFLFQFNGKALINPRAPDIIIEVDSCLTGGGGISEKRCYMYEYPKALAEGLHISQLEALNCLIAVRASLFRQRNKTVLIKCDNLGAVCVFRNSRGRDRIINAIARALWYFGAIRNIDLNFVHVPGAELGQVDALSRAFLSHDDMLRARHIVSSRSLAPIDIYPSFHDFNTYL